MKTCEHPTLPWTITFDPDEHEYRDQENRRYISGTGLVRRSFPEFDEIAAANRVAKRENRLAIEVLSEWGLKAQESSEYGMRVHAFAEALILGQQTPPATSLRDRRAFNIVRKAMPMLRDTYNFLTPEQIIFDPLYRVAGTIDLPAINKKNGKLAILDWKTCEGITEQSFGMALDPIAHVPDNKVNHYALQLSIYAWVMTHPEYTSYPSKGMDVELALIHIQHECPDPIWRPVPYLRDEATAVVMKWVEDAKKGVEA